MKDSFLKNMIANIQIAALSVSYRIHLKIRGVHDRLFLKNGFYRRWSEKEYSDSVHKAVLLAYIISLIVFTFFGPKS